MQKGKNLSHSNSDFDFVETNLKTSSHFLEKKKKILILHTNYYYYLIIFSLWKNFPTNFIYSVLKAKIRSQNEDVRRWNCCESRDPCSSRTTIRCLAVVISRMVVASYDGNTGNATLIHPGQAERPLHRCSLLCANGQSWKKIENLTDGYR